MKHTSHLRATLAGLSLVLASGAAIAQNVSTPGNDAAAATKPQVSQCEPGKSAHHRHGPAHHGHHGMKRAPMMALPASVLTQLNLTEAQKAKYFDAQTDTQAMKQAWHEAAKRQRSENRAQTDKTFDPKQMFERQNQRFEKMQQARLTIQKQWLGFWDSLNDAQKAVVQKHFQARFQRGNPPAPKQG